MQGDNLLHHALHHRLQGNPALLSALTLVSAGLIFFFCTSLSTPCSILPFLTQAECLQWVCWRCLELSVSGTGKPCPPLTRGSPIAPLSAPGTCTWHMSFVQSVGVLRRGLSTDLHHPLSCREYTSQTGLLHIHCTCGHHLCEVWKKTISEGYLFLNCYHCSNKMNNIHQNILKGSSCIFLSVVTQSVCLTGVLRALHQQWYRFIFLRYQSRNTSSQPSYTDENLNDTQLCRHCRRIKSFLKSYVGNREFLVLFLTSRTFSEKNISYVLSLYVCIYTSLGMTPGLHIFIIKPH